MAVSLKHKFTSAKADAADTSLVRASNWNDEHDLVLATGKLLGRSTAGTGAAEEISVGTGLSLSSGTLTATGGATRGGDTSTTGSADITLTSSSDLIQRVDMTATGKKVTLPDATTMNEGEFFVIVNTGINDFDVRANGGALVANLAGGGARIVWLNSTASAAGVWTALKTPSGAELSPGIAETLLSTSVDYLQAAALSATKAIVCYVRTSDNYGYAAVVDVSGTDLTWGTPAAYESAQTFNCAVAALSSTKAIVCYVDGANSSYGTACILDISGSTVTPGTPAVVHSVSTSDIYVAALSSTKAIVCYRKTFDGYGAACILDVSGSTITAGTPVDITSANTNAMPVAALSATKAIVCYKDINSFGNARVLDVSGSTITPGTALIFDYGVISDFSIAALSSTKVLYIKSDSEKILTQVLNISGSTVTDTVIWNTAAVTQAGSTYGIAALTSDRALLAGYGAMAVYMCNGDGFILNSQAVGLSGGFFDQYGSVVKLTDGLALVIAYDQNDSYYIKGVAVEYTP